MPNKKIEELKTALKKKHTIVFMAKCTVKYSGRAEAFLESGERVIMIKPDNTLIIHQPFGNAPVNYMKPGAMHKLIENKKDNTLLLSSTNNSLNEYIEINITKLISLNSAILNDSTKIRIFGTEKDMSDFIYDNPKVISKDFRPVSREEQTKYGFIDVFGYDKNKSLVVIECKRYTAGPTAPQQLRRYIERLAKSKGIKAKNIKGIIAAPKITKNALAMTKELNYEFKSIEPPAYMEKKKDKQNRLKKYF